MITTKEFEEAYGELNTKQKEAVDTIYGPVVVVAGPGTGKTQILALRIGNILLKSPGVKPEEILALTFTESAVATLRIRLASFIGSAAYRVRIHTFHGFARLLLEMRSDLFPRIALGTQLSDVRGISLMESLLDKGKYVKIRNPKKPYRMARSLLEFISTLKHEHYTSERYLAELTQKHEYLLADSERFHTTGKDKGKEKSAAALLRQRVEKHLEVAHLFGAYEEALEKESLYDYGDLINEAVRGLETDEGFRSQVGEQSQFVLADEHQDANPAQNRLLELVTDFDGEPNLFIVGDEKQAIFRFQGATLESFFYFKERYPHAKVISLTENYRSTENILTTAHDLVANVSVPDSLPRVTLKAFRGEGGIVEESFCDTPRAENEAILTHIKKLHEQNTSYEDIAILTKKNADVLALADSLRCAGIPEDHKSAEMSALTHPATQLFISLIRALTDLSQNVSLARALFIPGIPLPLGERIRLITLARSGKLLVEVLEKNNAPLMQQWVKSMRTLSKEMSSTPVVTWLARLAMESGFVAGILTLAESEDAYEAYQGFMEEASLLARENPGATAYDLLTRLALIEKHELRIQRARTQHAGVRIMTMHGAKGLEFPHVIIAYTTDEKWFRTKVKELSLLLEKREDEDDMRRLFYVALTRAKDSVLITHSKVTEEGRAQTPLRFLADISSHLAPALLSTRAPAPILYEQRTILDTNFLKERLLARGFSPTGFNNYVQSPWQYYFRTLLQLPDAPTNSMIFGTAIHEGLKSYSDATGKKGLEDALLTLRQELERLPLTELDRQEFLKKGTEVLRVYIAQETANREYIKESELPIRASLTVPGVGDVPLSGKLDRLDINKDGTVSVIDYKTGKAKSENDIRGNTKSSNGNYYRQLIFYKLLLDKEGRYTMNKGALHFVEPNEKGKCIVREFIITDAEVSLLEKELIEAAQKIAGGEAFKEPCDPKDCDYCQLVHFLLVH